MGMKVRFNPKQDPLKAAGNQLKKASKGAEGVNLGKKVKLP